jgi:putative tryptophan/tyrosine transport system substrate-binding protein
MEKMLWVRILSSDSDNRKSKIKNLKFGVVVGALLFALSVPAQAQQSGKGHRIGYLTTRSEASEGHRIAALQEGLRELGYTEGKNIVIELRRAAPGQRDRLRELVAELVRLKVDVIVVSGGALVPIAKEATTTIPIVFTVHADPVEDRVVASLARPGGNVTGLSDLHSVLVTKRLELLKEVAPAVSRVAVLLTAALPMHSRQLKDIQDAAPPFGVTVLPFPVTGREDIDRAFSTMKKEGAGGLLVLGDPTLGNLRPQVVDLAAKSRLPSIFTTSENVDAGGLMSYGANLTELWRRAATYVDKILKGAKPADLPVEQPTKFELVINLKTAKQIGLIIPQWVLMRADRVIK